MINFYKFKLSLLIVGFLSTYRILIFAEEPLATQEPMTEERFVEEKEVGQNEKCGYEGHKCSGNLKCEITDYEKEDGSRIDVSRCVGRGWINDYCPYFDQKEGSPHCGGSRVCRDVGTTEEQYRCVGGGEKKDYCRKKDPGSKDCKGSLLCRESEGAYKCK